MRGKLYLTPASRSACAQARQAYKPIEGHSQQDVIEKVINSLEGGGGTTIEPVLRKVSNLMRNKDIIVIFSDFCIWDWEDDDVQELLRDLASRASVAVLVSTDAEPDPMPEGWIFVKVEIERD